MTFQGGSGATPDLGTNLVGGKLVHPRALVTNNPGSLNTTLEILRPKLGVLRLRRGYRGWYTGNGITRDASQPGGPHKGGRRIIARMVHVLFRGLLLKMSRLCRNRKAMTFFF